MDISAVALARCLDEAVTHAERIMGDEFPDDRQRKAAELVLVLAGVSKATRDAFLSLPRDVLRRPDLLAAVIAELDGFDGNLDAEQGWGAMVRARIAQERASG